MWAPTRWGTLAASERLTRRVQRGSFSPFPPRFRPEKKKRPETWRFGSFTAVFFLVKTTLLEMRNSEISLILDVFSSHVQYVKVVDKWTIRVGQMHVDSKKGVANKAAFLCAIHMYCHWPSSLVPCASWHWDHVSVLQVFQENQKVHWGAIQYYFPFNWIIYAGSPRHCK